MIIYIVLLLIIKGKSHWLQLNFIYTKWSEVWQLNFIIQFPTFLLEIQLKASQLFGQYSFYLFMCNT
jgi:hypothetical protein